VTEVLPVATVKIDLLSIAVDRRQKYKETHGEYPETLPIRVIIEVVVSSMKGIMEVFAKVDHKRVGQTSIEYFADPAWHTGLVQNNDEDERVQNDPKGKADIMDDACDEFEDDTVDEIKVQP
jgi:hypothetical protein